MSNGIKALVFDYDGTLADSALSVLPVYNALAPGLGLPAMTEADIPRLRRLGPMRVMEEYRIPLWKVPLLVAQVRREIEQRQIIAAPFAGLDQVFADLKTRRARNFIVSSNSRKNIDRFLARHPLGDFERIDCGSSLFGKGRRLRRLLQVTRLEPGLVAYVGDETRDIDAAREAGVTAIAVSWGYGDRDALVASRPDFIVDGPDGFQQLVEQLMGPAPNASGAS